MRGIGYSSWPHNGMAGQDDEVALDTVDWAQVNLRDVDWALMRRHAGYKVQRRPSVAGHSASGGLLPGLGMWWIFGDTSAQFIGGSHFITRTDILDVLDTVLTWPASDVRRFWTIVRGLVYWHHAPHLPELPDLRLLRAAVSAASDWAPYQRDDEAMWEEFNGSLPVPLMSDARSRLDFDEGYLAMKWDSPPGWVRRNAWWTDGGREQVVPDLHGPQSAAAGLLAAVLQPVANDAFRLWLSSAAGGMALPSLLPEQRMDLSIQDPVRVVRWVAQAARDRRAELVASIRTLLAIDADPEVLAWSMWVWSAPEDEATMNHYRWPSSALTADNAPPGVAALRWWDWLATSLEGAMPIPEDIPWNGPRDPVPLERILATGDN